MENRRHASGREENFTDNAPYSSAPLPQSGQFEDRAPVICFCSHTHQKKGGKKTVFWHFFCWSSSQKVLVLRPLTPRPPALQLQLLQHGLTRSHMGGGKKGCVGGKSGLSFFSSSSSSSWEGTSPSCQLLCLLLAGLQGAPLLRKREGERACLCFSLSPSYCV